MPNRSHGLAQRSRDPGVVDPVVLYVEHVLDVRLVNDRQVLRDRHRQYLPRRRLRGGAGAPKGDRRTGSRPGCPPAASFGLASTHSTCQVPVRLPGERPKVCRPTQ